MRPIANKVLMAMAAICLLCCGRASAQNVTSDQVRTAVENAVAYLKGQEAGGRWGGGGRGNQVADGTTALAVLALLNAGVPADDPAVAAGLQEVAGLDNKSVYVTSIKCQVLAIAGRKYYQELTKAAQALWGGQLDVGMWSYTTDVRMGRGDNSNTQFALLGLFEAAKAGVPVPATVWEKSRKHFENTQIGDGGWMYSYIMGRGGVPPAGGSTATMTAAGVASLYICGQRLMTASQRVFSGGKYASCGRYSQYKPLAEGHKWLADNFDKAAGAWSMYYQYALERVGMLSGVRNFGPHDWYREGAAKLVATQRPNGGWGGQLYDSAFALLFLAKGNRPVIIQKLQWAGDWCRNRYDLENFTAAIGDKLGKKTTWQTVTLDLSVEELRQAPILYITGHTFPIFMPDQIKKLRLFVDSGGTILADACCGSEAFRKGMADFVAKAFPEYELRPLDISHPAFSAVYPLKSTYGLQGVDVGCRTAIFFSPNAISPLWELQNAKDTMNPAVTSEYAFQLGTNIAAYATGREMLADKLDKVELPQVAEHAGQVGEIPRGAVRIATLYHGGDYNADVHCTLNLAAMLRDKANVDVVAQTRKLQATEKALFDYPVIFMTGHYKFDMNDDEITALRTYLQKGGTIVADACCGKKEFDAGFRAMMAKVLPDSPLQALAAGHAIYTGRAGLELGELKYRKVLADELGSASTNRPPLEAASIGGRTCVIYSKYDFTCALEGDNPFSCRGYADEDGRRLALLLFLYAIAY